MDETQYGETLVTDNPFINAPRYFKLFECGKNFMNNIDTTYERSRMETLQRKRDTENCRYGRACMLENKENYYT